MKLSKEDIERIQFMYEKLKVPELSEREHPINERKRNPFERDYARILYSSAFRRLQGKMQILGINTSAFYRNRLTHSLEVCHIARSIALMVAEICDPDSKMHMYDDDLFVIEAAALAHDIGHPAFGHKGERVLGSVNPTLAFEGNAQNFRLLRVLEDKEPDCHGLNLTKRTLLAINKYIVREGDSIETKKDGKKVSAKAGKFLYKSDYDYLNSVREVTGLLGERTLDVQIIELADDIAYAVHDLEDGLWQRLFTLDELNFELSRKNEKAGAQFSELIQRAQEKATKLNEDPNSTMQRYTHIFYRALTSELTHAFIHDIGLKKMDDANFCAEHGISTGKYELALMEYDELCHALAKMIFKCASRQTDIALYELRGEIVLGALYKLYSNPLKNDKGALLPPEYRVTEKNQNPNRAVIDFLAGMMDTFAIKLYEDYFNTSFDDIAVDTYRFGTTGTPKKDEEQKLPQEKKNDQPEEDAPDHDFKDIRNDR